MPWRSSRNSLAGHPSRTFGRRLAAQQVEPTSIVSPLDRAAETGLVRFGYCLAGEDEVDRLVEQLPGDRLAVAGGRVVEGAAIGELAIGVVQEEVWCAGRAVRPANLLLGVDEVREREPRPVGLSA